MEAIFSTTVGVGESNSMVVGGLFQGQEALIPGHYELWVSDSMADQLPYLLDQATALWFLMRWGTEDPPQPIETFFDNLREWRKAEEERRKTRAAGA